ncbi:putative disease resistance protein [Prunus yedoensis var. nudiflora]|uniref:Putative disease resistance protein n=1 Tax=Prunus yedoensis var. nudiflora TaxID=2094558 RepID=A0A314UNE9_PRUYE|nr:putative disease resistance protein [Prunus yedoensis var. nudiflora]
MAEAVVAFVSERLADFIVQQVSFLKGVGDQVKHAQTKLQLMQCYLKDADERQGDNEVIRFCIANIRDAAYDLEDVVETFAFKVASQRRGSMKIVLKRISGRIMKEGVFLYKIGSEIDKMTGRISELRDALHNYKIQPITWNGGATSSSSFERQQDQRLTYPHVVERDVVGLEDDVKMLAMQLLKEEKCFEVVSIWGMAGSGKTTIAKQVYHHDEVRRYFDCFAWVCISQRCQGRDILEQILIKLTSATKEQRKEIGQMKKDEIAEKLCTIFRERKCMVVLDDIWTCEAWNSLKVGFPIKEETKSRMLLTTRNKVVASHADENGLLHQPRPLDDDESWELFEKIAISGSDHTNSETNAKKELGRKMLQHCAGLPLAISVLAGLLARKGTVGEWEAVYNKVNVIIRRGTDTNIEVKNTKLWIAEGFISSASSETMEDVAYNCLSELVERCMVQVGKTGSTQKAKTCRLHDLMRDLCVLKAKEENFLIIVPFSTSIATSTTPTGNLRRLAIHVDRGSSESAPRRHERVGRHTWCRITEFYRESTPLKTLVNISSGDCVLNGLAHLTSLRKLFVKVRRDSENLEEILTCTSIILNRLQSLSVYSNDDTKVPLTILLSCRDIYKLQLHAPIVELPEKLHNYPNLTKITLRGAHLKEDDIEILQTLRSLRMLFLDNFGTLGTFPDTLVCSAGGFCFSNFFPFVGCLAIPEGLQYVTTLKELAIGWMPDTFCSGLREGGVDFYKVQHVPTVKFS